MAKTKTVTELASELGYTRQYIQKIINQLPANKKPKKVGNKYSISLQNESVIRRIIKKSQTKSETQSTTSLHSELSAKNTYIQHLEQENSYLQQQLEHSQQLLDHEQQLHLADQKRINQLEQPEDKQATKANQHDDQTTNNNDNQQEEQPKKGFFNRLFGSK